jgi:colanic acid/amylovoran biosynthesis glycosyltransferase
MLRNLAVAQPNRNNYSETFIRNHIRHLGDHARVHDLAGGWIPTHADGRPLAPRWIPAIEKALARLSGRPFIHGLLSHRVERYLREERIELVLSEFGPSGVAMLPICRKLGIPLVVHFHGADLHVRRIFRRYEKAYRRLVRDAQGVVVVSRLQRSMVEALGCPPEKISHVVCGADLMFRGVASGKAKAAPILLCVGRMIEKKGPDRTIRAFARIASEFPEARLHFIGNGPFLPVCRDLARELHVSEKVSFLPPQPASAIVEAMSDAFCYVQHSLTAADGDSEGTPVSVLEAGLAGLPVVATRHAGIADVVVEGRTGLLVAENDEEGMADGLRYLLQHPLEAEAMGRAASAHIEANYSMPVSIAKLWAALQAAVISGTGR